MDRKTIDEIIGRAITDAEFRRKLKVDVRKTLIDAGYPVDEQFLALVDPAHLQELDVMVEEYEKRYLGGQSVPDAMKSGGGGGGGGGSGGGGSAGGGGPMG